MSLDNQIDEACRAFDKHYDSCKICDNDGNAFCSAGSLLNNELEVLINKLKSLEKENKVVSSGFGQLLLQALKKE